MTVGRGSTANLISEITNPCVLDHLNLISVAWKDHNTLLPLCGESISAPAPCCCMSLEIRWGESGLRERGDLELSRSKVCELASMMINGYVTIQEPSAVKHTHVALEPWTMNAKAKCHFSMTCYSFFFSPKEVVPHILYVYSLCVFLFFFDGLVPSHKNRN